MKSKYFSSSTLKDEGLADFKNTFTCSDNLFDTIIGWFNKHEEMPRVDDVVVANFHRETEEDVKIIQSVVSLILHVVKNSPSDLNDINEVSYFFEDFQELYKDEFKEVESFINRLDTLEKLSLKYFKFMKKSRAETKGNDTLVYASCSVALKPIFNQDFDYDNMSIENYNPELESFSPVVMMSLATQSDQNMNFQIKTKDFSRFLNDLIALKVQLDEVEKKWEQKNG